MYGSQTFILRIPAVPTFMSSAPYEMSPTARVSPAAATLPAAACCYCCGGCLCVATVGDERIRRHCMWVVGLAKLYV